jgi:uncharacterized membrane protein YqaE (UPF0057 family)
MKAFFLKPIIALTVIGLFAGSIQTAVAAEVSASFFVIKHVSKDSSALSRKDSIQNAITAFKNLSHKEKKELIKEAKQKLNEYKEQKKNGLSHSDDNTILLVILAILLPPLAVYLHEGEINSKFWIDLILTLLFWLPGAIYALIVVLD